MKIKKIPFGQIILNFIFIMISLAYILPFILLLSISFSSEQAIKEFGYTLLPKAIDFEGYRLILQNPMQLVNSYKVTIIFSVVTVMFSLVVKALLAYPLSRPNYKFKKAVTIYIFFTMLFSGGLVPSYIINTKYLHLDNTVWIYILPALVSAWDIIIIRTFFKSLPEGLVEAAKIDGASELRICFQIILPLSTAVMATIGFLTLIGKWNDWNTALIYIRDPQLYSLQYLLQKILREAEFVKSMASKGQVMQGYEAPTETMRYAMAVLAAGPMLGTFPFFQKYFAKGLTVGAIKG